MQVLRRQKVVSDHPDDGLVGPTRGPMAVGLGLAAPLVNALAQATSNCAPFPWLSPLLSVVGEIIQLCDNVVANKRAAVQLTRRCQQLLDTFTRADEAASLAVLPPQVQRALEKAHELLVSIKDRMAGWASLGKMKSFYMQADIAADIERCHVDISDCCAKFEITSQIAVHQWQQEWKHNADQDHQEVMEVLATINENQLFLSNQVLESTLEIRNLARFVQQGLSDYAVGDFRHTGLQKNLYKMTARRGDLLPDLELKRGEVRRVGLFPGKSFAGGSAAMDIWEGVYLDHDKVAIKVVRAVNAGPKSHERFRREVSIWHEVWKRDGGKYILPIYGFCQNDGPFPYMISPWQPNGVAIDYVKRNPDVDHMALVRGIARGIQVLHTLEPPVVHGDIKGANVVIGAMGQPLLADFGVSKVVEDITGVPFTQSRGVSDSYRWFAPELCIGQGILTLQADIYAYGMTVLEPFSYIKHTTEAVVEVAKRNRPRRPTEQVVVARGMDDKLWSILQACWKAERTDRPHIRDIVENV
ncbi:kinase-like protein [Gloeophyllum trabeum ATCC 11539]|uniref:Kinase-like protein n=1 Tax=Gloeophyllum trabeum (strain ATCC 11539 / FP-39264 / Madison 617) TaxID=670483 RepID=S7QJ19_GLOTA|nr:kinase-like protein [Gloeophyllum trabeum ATCC 11539]EPQ59367.1 kinase-like protein [Gloeophyllum trabeum ATCC 11539]